MGTLTRDRGRKAILSATFAALVVPNYRRYLSGQALSLIGTWMQATAQAWLVLVITGSGTDLGVVVALQTMPILLIGPTAGVIADRVDRLRVMIALQIVMAALALLLGVLAIAHRLGFVTICVLALLLGLVQCVETPIRQSFVMDMVGREHILNAVTLNNILVNASRGVGAGLAGALIAATSIGTCFLLNAVSFVAVVWSLLRIDRDRLHLSPPVPRRRGQFREGLRYVAKTPQVRYPLIMMALIGCFTYEYPVTLPLMAKHAFTGDASVYGLMVAAMAVGAVFGGLYTAARARTGMRSLTRSAAIFGLLAAVAALSTQLIAELFALAALGASSVGFLSQANTAMQLGATPQMRGRVMALWAAAFLGSAPIGGPLVGSAAQHFGTRWGLGVGAVACAFAVVVGLIGQHETGSTQPSVIAGL